MKDVVYSIPRLWEEKCYWASVAPGNTIHMEWVSYFYGTQVYVLWCHTHHLCLLLFFLKRNTSNFLVANICIFSICGQIASIWLEMAHCLVTTRLSHVVCGHLVNETPSGVVECSFCLHNCDSEVIRSFHLKITLADKSGKIFAWSAGQTAIELLQISPDEFHELPEVIQYQKTTLNSFNVLLFCSLILVLIGTSGRTSYVFLFTTEREIHCCSGLLQHRRVWTRWWLFPWKWLSFMGNYSCIKVRVMFESVLLGHWKYQHLSKRLEVAMTLYLKVQPFKLLAAADLLFSKYVANIYILKNVEL